MKFLFINTPDNDRNCFLGAPTSLYYACSLLTAESTSQKISLKDIADIKFFDPRTPEKMLTGLPLIAADKEIVLAGFSATSHSHWTALQGAKIVRDVNPDALIIFGGPHEDEMSSNLNHVYHILNRWRDRVDMVASGDGEFILEWLCHLILEITKSIDRVQKLHIINQHGCEISQLPGKGFLDVVNGSNLSRYKLSQKLLPLNQIPFLNWSFVEPYHFYDFPIFKDEFQGFKKTVQIMTHRGCNGTCSFCTERGSLNRRSPRLIIEEIEKLRNKHNIEAIFFDDSTFSDDRKSLITLCNELRNCKIEWGCLTRYDKVDQSILRNMKNAGCSYIYFGLEQYDDEILQRIGKRIKTSWIDKVMHVCKNEGIKVGLSTLWGIGEPMDVVKKTIDKISLWSNEKIVSIVSLSANCYHPNSVMTRMNKYDKYLDYDREPPHQGLPWLCYEEGLWYHPHDFNEEYAGELIDLFTKTIPFDVFNRKQHILRALSCDTKLETQMCEQRH